MPAARVFARVVAPKIEACRGNSCVSDACGAPARRDRKPLWISPERWSVVRMIVPGRPMLFASAKNSPVHAVRRILDTGARIRLSPYVL